MVSSKDLRWLALATQIATESNCHSKHGCVIVKSGRILSLAANRFSVSHPVCHKYKKQSLHAEQRALIKIRFQAEGSTLYSVRLHDNPISLPCAMCLDLSTFAGIRTIVYNDGNELKKVRL